MLVSGVTAKWFSYAYKCIHSFLYSFLILNRIPTGPCWLSFFFFFWPHCMWDLSSVTRNWKWGPHKWKYQVLSTGQQGNSLVICLMYSSVCMFIPSSWYFPPSTIHFLFGNHKFVFDICKSVSEQTYFVNKFICITSIQYCKVKKKKKLDN